MNISSLEIIVKSNFCLWTNLYLPFEDIGFLPCLALFLSLQMKIWPKNPFLLPRLYFLQILHGFLRKKIIFQSEIVIWAIWPNLVQIWPYLVQIWPQFGQGWLCMVFFLLTGIGQPYYGVKKIFKNFTRNQAGFSLS